MDFGFHNRQQPKTPTHTHLHLNLNVGGVVCHLPLAFFCGDEKLQSTGASWHMVYGSGMWLGVSYEGRSRMVPLH
jgi:hypothetical protein